MNNELSILTDAELDPVSGGKSNAVKDFYNDLNAMGIVADFVHLAEKAVNTAANLIANSPIPIG